MFRTFSVVLSLILSSQAFASEPASAPASSPSTPPASAPAAPPAFESLDANKDAALDKTEIAKVGTLVAEFATVDADKNGKIAKAEFDAWAAKQKPATPPASGTAPANTAPPAK